MIKDPVRLILAQLSARTIPPADHSCQGQRAHRSLLPSELTGRVVFRDVLALDLASRFSSVSPVRSSYASELES